MGTVLFLYFVFGAGHFTWTFIGWRRPRMYGDADAKKQAVRLLLTPVWPIVLGLYLARAIYRLLEDAVS
jgi:hypothetical protein